MNYFQTAPVKFLILGMTFLTLFFTSSCGSKEQDESLKVKLSIPQEEEESLFWYGVKDRRIAWVSESGTHEQEWVPGKKLEWEVAEGDEIQFNGYSDQGQLIVVGSGKVSEAKMVSILLRRVL